MDTHNRFQSPVAIEPLNGMMINVAYREQLRAAGLDSLARVWSSRDGEVIKRIPERTVTRIAVAGPGTAFYLKKHNEEPQLMDWRRSEGGTEFHHLCGFRQAGLATAVPVAAGVASRRDGSAGSFLLTEDFSPLTALEEIIRQRPHELAGAQLESRRRALLRAIALYARQMHAAGFNHRDHRLSLKLGDDFAPGLGGLGIAYAREIADQRKRPVGNDEKQDEGGRESGGENLQHSSNHGICLT